MRSTTLTLLAVLLCWGGTATAAERSLSPAEVFIHEKLGDRCRTRELWPGKPPDRTGDIGSETVVRPEKKSGFARVKNVTEPSLTVCPPKDAHTPTPAIMVCPGGGYHILALEHEGTEIAGWLNSLGITAIVLKYRVPRRKHGHEKHHHALQDAQRAMGLIRAHSGEWNIDPDRVGVLGFSAGGHLTATLSNNYDRRIYDHVDDADGKSCRPTIAVPIYPAYLRRSDDSLKLAELQHPGKMSPESTPPTFIAASQMDRYMPNSLAYLRALTKADVPAELHVYPKGRHGTGMRAYPFRTWTTECERWLGDRNFIAEND